MTTKIDMSRKCIEAQINALYGDKTPLEVRLIRALLDEREELENALITAHSKNLRY